MNWKTLNLQERQKAYYQPLKQFINEEYQNYTCYPPKSEMFKALELTPFDNVKCVILGQDPYHEAGQAMGLAFSVNKNVQIPKSLSNIFKELCAEYDYPIPTNGDLTPWAKQGVLLLNSILSVRAHQANSHCQRGWEEYTDAILEALNKRNEPTVFMLWGNTAQTKARILNNSKHLILRTSHPSPFAAHLGFIGCDHFKKCNAFLVKNNIEPIDWRL